MKDHEIKAYTYDDLVSKLRMFLAAGFGNQMNFDSMDGDELVKFVEESGYCIEASTTDIAAINKIYICLKDRHKKLDEYLKERHMIRIDFQQNIRGLDK